MIVEYIRYHIDASQLSTFVEAYKQASSILDNSNFCLGYELSECEEENGRFIMRIEWTSTVDHLAGFRGSDAYQDFLHIVRPYIDKVKEMRHYQLTDVVNHKQRETSY